jgi:ABC-2 type transport system permease protein
MRLLQDVFLVFNRSMRISLRNPTWLVVGLMQPVLYLCLFGPLLTKVANLPGFPPGDAWQVFVPGMLVMLGLFGSAFVGFSLLAEYRCGVVERMRVTPMSRAALLLGRVGRDLVVLLVQGIVLILVALAFGLRAPLGGIVIGVLLVIVLGVTMASISYGLALVLKSEDAFAPLLNSFMLPLMLLSGILMPMSLGPDWLYDLSRINPLSYVVDGARAAFRGDVTGHTFVAGILIAVALAVLGAAFGTRVFRRENT